MAKYSLGWGLVERSPDSFWRGLLGVGAEIGTGFADPINYVPLFGPATRAVLAARAGRALGVGPAPPGVAGAMGRAVGHGVVHGGEAAALTAAVEPFIVLAGNRLGDDMSFAEAALDVAFAGAAGGVLGGAYGALASVRGRPASPRAAMASNALLDEAVRKTAAGEPVQISPATFRAAGETIAREAGVRPGPVDGPVGGPAMPRGRFLVDPADRQGSVRRFLDVVRASPRDNSFHLVYGAVPGPVVDRVRADAGADVSGYAWIVTASDVRHTLSGHGPDSPAARSGEKPVTADDLARFDEIAARAESVRRVRTRRGADAVEFVTPENGDVFLVTAIRSGRKALALHSMYRRPRRRGEGSGNSGGGDLPGLRVRPEEPSLGLRPSPPEGRPRAESATAPDSIAPPGVAAIPRPGEAPPGALRELEPAYAELGEARLVAPAPDPAPEPAPAVPDPKGVTPAETAEAMGLDLDGGHDLEAAIGQLGDEGRLTAETAAELDAATALVERADAYARAYAAAAACLTRQ